GTIIRDRLSEAGFSVTEVIVVRDDAKAIAELLQQQIAENINLVLTTGGTGLGPRDVIVEATRQGGTRAAPGIAEGLRSYGQKRTPFAMISQGIAGIAGHTLIVNLPGSPSGVEDSLHALFPALFHAFPMMNGGGHV